MELFKWAVLCVHTSFLAIALYGAVQTWRLGPVVLDRTTLRDLPVSDVQVLRTHEVPLVPGAVFMRVVLTPHASIYDESQPTFMVSVEHLGGLGEPCSVVLGIPAKRFTAACSACANASYIELLRADPRIRKLHVREEEECQKTRYSLRLMCGHLFTFTPAGTLATEIPIPRGTTACTATVNRESGHFNGAYDLDITLLDRYDG
jgi:hypothetical protein